MGKEALYAFYKKEYKDKEKIRFHTATNLLEIKDLIRSITGGNTDLFWITPKGLEYYRWVTEEKGGRFSSPKKAID